MPLGIRPTNDFAFLKTFGSPENKIALISLLNSILGLPHPIADVTIVNPFNLQDFKDDKLSVLDVKAVDRDGAIYNVEMQIAVLPGLIQRLVFYGCEIYADQLRSSDDYTELRPAYTICLIEGQLWQDNHNVHHAFKFTDIQSGRVLDESLQIHTLELGKYNLQETDLATASRMECWLYWFMHAHEYEPEELLKLFPDAAFQQASQALTHIKEKTEDKVMYDSREKARLDREWQLSSSFLAGKEEGKEEGKIEGKIEGKTEGEIIGKIELIRTLQAILDLPLSPDAELQSLTLAELIEQVDELRQKIQQRPA